MLLIFIFPWIQALATSIITFSPMYPVFSRNNEQLVYISNPYNINKAKIIKISTKNGAILKSVPLRLSSRVKVFAATPDGFKFLATSPTGIAVIHNGTSKVLRTLPYPSKYQHNAYSFRQSDDGVLLAIPSITSKSRKINVIHTGTGKLMYVIDLLKNQKWVRYPTIRAIGFSHKRRYLAYVYETSDIFTLHVYDLYKKAETLKLQIPAQKYDEGEIRFSKNGNYLIFTGINMKQLFLLDLKKRSLQTLKLGYSAFTGFTPDDQKLILVQFYKKRILLKNIKTGKEIVRPTNFEQQQGTYASGTSIVQSADRSLLALPIRSLNYENINNFLLVNAQNGQVLRQIKAK